MKARHSFPLSSPWSQPGHVIISGALHKTEIQSRRELDYFGMVLVTSGNGWFEDARTPRSAVPAGGLFFLYPGIWHSYGPDKGGCWDEIFLVFAGEIPRAWQKAGWLPERPPLLALGSGDDAAAWARKIEAVPGKRMPWDAKSCCEEICRLQQLLSEVLAFRESNRQRQEGDRRWAGEVDRLLEKQLRQPSDWDALAARLGMGYEAFRKRFSRVFGVPPVKHLTRLRINRACDMLAHPAASNRMVADVLGFCDEYYFSRCFTQVVGMTPREFRRQMWRVDSRGV